MLRPIFIAILTLFSIGLFSQETGLVSVYPSTYENRKTANDEIYSSRKLTASHKRIKFGHYVRVVRTDNSASVIVKINDRGPYVGGRIMDLSTAAARKLGMKKDDVIEVEIFDLGTNYKKKSSKSSVEKLKSSSVENAKKINEIQQESSSKPIYKSTSYKRLKKNINPEESIIAINMAVVPKQGFGVQLGLYSSFNSIFLLSGKLPEKYYDKTLVKTGTKNNTKIYKLIIGPFTSRNEAKSAQNVLRKISKDCIIVSL